MIDSNVEVVIAPSQVHLSSVRDSLRGDIQVSAQDVWKSGAGAYTGETNAGMLTDLGVKWSLIGHSERRQKGESDAECASKAKHALDNKVSYHVDYVKRIQPIIVSFEWIISIVICVG